MKAYHMTQPCRLSLLSRFARTAAGILAALLLAAALLTGCTAAQPVSTAANPSEAASEAASPEAAAISVHFAVTNPDGAVTDMTLAAQDGETLAAALLAAGLISAEEHDAGFVTTVNGITADYNADGAWWALVDANGEQTANGISDIVLHDGDGYGFVYTVG